MSKNHHAVTLGKKGGQIGGRSRSPAKIATARKNGAKGGRPTLVPPAIDAAGEGLEKDLARIGVHAQLLHLLVGTERDVTALLRLAHRRKKEGAK